MLRKCLVQIVTILITFSRGALPAGDIRAQPVPVRDPELIRKISALVPLDAACLADQDLEIAPVSAKDPGLVLLCGGTEVGRLTEKQSRSLYAAFPDALASPSQSASSESGDEIGASLSLLRMGEWPAGIEAQYGVDYAYSSILVRRNMARLEASHNLGRLFLGAGIHHITFKGDLADSIAGAKSAKSLGGSLSIGIPFLKYTMNYAPHALPEYFWLEQNLKNLYFNRTQAKDDAKLMKGFRSDAAGKIGHDLGLKFGYLRYDLIYQPDVYKQAVHRLYLQDFPLLFAKFSMGFYGSGSLFVPGIDLRLFPLSARKLTLGATRLPLTWTPIDVQYHRMQAKQFLLAFKTGLSFDMPSAQ